MLSKRLLAIVAATAFSTAALAEEAKSDDPKAAKKEQGKGKEKAEPKKAAKPKPEGC